MTEQELLLRLERLEARGEIENLMARYQHYYTLRNSQAILDELWAEDVCGITLEDRFYGVYEGRSGAFPDAGMKTYYDSAMGFGYASDHPGKLVVYTLTTQALEVAADGLTARGLWLSIGAEGDGGELSYPDLGRPDRKVSGVHLTSVTADGKRYQADWVWQKIAVDLIRRETGWRIWHMHIYDIFRCPFGQDWVTFSAQRPALNELWAVERCFTPYGKPPGHGCQYHWEYSLDSQPSPWPTPPLPYANADGLGRC